MKKPSKTLATVAASSMLFMSTAYASTQVKASHSSSNGVAVTIKVESPQSVARILNEVCLFAETMLKNPPHDGSFDTSGFVQDVYSKVNVKLPRTILEQSKVGKRITGRSQLQKGDLVFFDLSNSNHHEVTITFDGIYLGKNTVAALTSHGLMAINMYSEYWLNKFRFGVRVL